MAGNNDKLTKTALVPAITIEQAREQLVRFLTLNPVSSIDEVDVGSGKRVAITNPWGDSSLIIPVPTNNPAFLATMNNLRLPERLTAIWHVDSKALEVIYTARPLPKHLKEVASRQFSFRHNSQNHECKFARSSDRLLVIAQNSQPITESSTQWRNLPSFNLYAQRQAEPEEDTELAKVSLGEPLSFWIGDVDWNDDDVLNLVDHINFYMSYYDTLSPGIIVHDLTIERAAHQPQTRNILGHFPEQITSHQIDQILVHLWLAARSGDAARRFLYSYRIIEYASFFFLEKSAKDKIRRLLEAPHALDDLTNLTEQVISTAQESKLHDIQKIEAFLRLTVDPKLIWREMEQNINAFATATVFDGGFIQRSITKLGTQEADFGANEMSAFCTAIRDIRNALSHGRDAKTTTVITPTTQNFERLQPWASAIAVAAGEAIVYRGLT